MLELPGLQAPVYYSGSNEPSIAPQFKWLEYTFNCLSLLLKKLPVSILEAVVVDLHRFNADSDPTFNFNCDPDPDSIPSFTHITENHNVFKTFFQQCPSSWFYFSR